MGIRYNYYNMEEGAKQLNIFGEEEKLDANFPLE